MLVVRMVLAVVLLAGTVGAQTRLYDLRGVAGGLEEAGEYAAIDPAELRRHPERFDGQRVTLTAEVVSISAKYSIVHIFDGRSRSLISVALDDITQAKRHSIVHDQVRRLAVFGRVGLDRGLWVVRAEKVEAVKSEIAFISVIASNH